MMQEYTLDGSIREHTNTRTHMDLLTHLLDVLSAAVNREKQGTDANTKIE